VKLTIKVDLKRSNDPVAHVRSVLHGAGAAGAVEEVFPGLRDGASAGLVAVTLPDTLDPAVRRAALKALRHDEAIAYVEAPKPRHPL
jgi:hypothetical protein